MNRLIQSFDSATDKIQLICFPFAGGYSASFHPLHAFLRNDCQLLAVEPPGHGTNRMPLVPDLEKLVDMYMCELLPRLGKPFVLFGHSMGGMVVYRLAQKLERQGISPKAVIISAVQPPQISRMAVSHLENGAFLDHVIGLGGIPPELVEAKEVLEFFLPAFRADFQALETFRHTDRNLLLSPIHIFNGDQDEACLRDASGWKEWGYQVRFHTFRGGHMFLQSEAEKVTKTIQFLLSFGSAREAIIV